MDKRFLRHAIGWPVAIIAVVAGFQLGTVNLFGTTGGEESTSAFPPPASISVPTTTATPSAAADTLKFGSAADREAGVTYLRSPARIASYKKAWPAAGKVAHAMMAGKFGPIEKYTEMKETRPVGYVGWGGMQTTDHQQYAWVWWNADGSINYKKGILGFSVGGLQIESVDSGNGPYQVFIPKDGYTVVIDAEYFGGISPLFPYRSPVTTSEAQLYDSEALGLLDANMKRAGL